jgi:ribonucleoside-triphosphate reductase
MAGENSPYYTNSSQLPVQYTDDLFVALEHQEGLQTLYTGGTVLHIFLGEAYPDNESLKKLIKTVFSKYKLPYISITPTFSVCKKHGYINGEHFDCPVCKQEKQMEIKKQIDDIKKSDVKK